MGWILFQHSSIVNDILRIVNLFFLSVDFPASCKSAQSTELVWILDFKQILLLLLIISLLIKNQGLDSEILKNYRPVANLSFI